jgi:hypothetical protein
MPAVPRIDRAVPHGPKNHPEQGIPVIATLHWHHGVDQEVLATAIAWTRNAVEVSWEMEPGEGLRSDWIPAHDVRRLGEAPKPVNLPPRTRAGTPRPRW